jgi:Rod binding domain-containing protein
MPSNFPSVSFPSAISYAGTVAPLPADASVRPQSTKIKDAARQFEGVMIAQMLHSARESSSASGGLGLGHDDSDGEANSETSVVLDMAEQQFANMLAQQGGFGLSQLVIEGLNKTS